MIKLDQWRQLGVWLERPGTRSWNQVLEPRICVALWDPCGWALGSPVPFTSGVTGKKAPVPLSSPPSLPSPLPSKHALLFVKRSTTQQEAIIISKASSTNAPAPHLSVSRKRTLGTPPCSP